MLGHHSLSETPISALVSTATTVTASYVGSGTIVFSGAATTLFTSGVAVATTTPWHIGNQWYRNQN